jgi:serine O-acetyltransferase
MRSTNTQEPRSCCALIDFSKTGSAGAASTIGGDLFEHLLEDLRVVRHHDPAATSDLETLLCHSPLHAIFLHRVAHILHARYHVPLLPRLLSTFARFLTGVEIHPGARIGRRFFIDHGVGVVIGETAEIGDDCVLFHNVTLGGTGKHRGKRHPSLRDNVFVGTSATLLGPITIGSNAKIGANSFIRMHDVPANCTAAGSPARIVKRDGRRVNEDLPPTQLSERSIPIAIPGRRAAPPDTSPG